MYPRVSHLLGVFMTCSVVVNSLPATIESIDDELAGAAIINEPSTFLVPVKSDNFYYVIPETNLAIDGRIDGPDAKDLPVKLLTNVLQCAVNHADKLVKAESDATVRPDGWATRQRGLQLSVEHYETGPPIPLKWVDVRDALSALQHQMGRLGNRESVITIIKLAKVSGQTDKTELGHITITLLPAEGIGSTAEACYVRNFEGQG